MAETNDTINIGPATNNQAAMTCNRMRSIVLTCIALIAIVFAVYIQVGNHDFLDYDDNVYVTANPHVTSGITGDTIFWAFTSVYAGNWHPVTWLSHMADVQFYGMNPGGHHLTSVVIHAVSAVLLFLLLCRLTGARWQSLFVAALFALHPLHVESVAWVAERKDVLSAFFGFLALLCYSEYAVKRQPLLYMACFISFVMGLMSKSMLVTLPAVMLLLDYWPLGRYRQEEQEGGLPRLFKRTAALVKEKIPLFVCSFCSGIVTIYAQHSGGAMSDLDAVSIGLRIENALIAYVSYIGKTFWPHDLAVFYPLSFYHPLWQVVSSLLLLLFISAAVVRARHRYPYLAVGWFWFIITLLPVIGLVQVGGQSMADRYSYIPVIGLFIIAAWGGADLTSGFSQREGIRALLAGTICIVSAVFTWQQLGCWRDSVSLYRHTLQATAENYWIHYNLGVALANKGDLNAAIPEFRETLRIKPDYSKAHNNLGFVYATKGNLAAAIHEFREALRITPNGFDFHNNLGLVLVKEGELDAAILEFQEALRINPAYAEAEKNLGVALGQKRMEI